MATRWGAVRAENVLTERIRTRRHSTMSAHQTFATVVGGGGALVLSTLGAVQWIGPYSLLCMGSVVVVLWALALLIVLHHLHPLLEVGYDLTERGILRHREVDLSMDNPRLSFFPLNDLRRVWDYPDHLEFEWTGGQRWTWPKERINQYPVVEGYFLDHGLLRPT